MIVAIEGADCSGKTTMFHALYGLLPEGTVYVPRRKVNNLNEVQELSLSAAHLWAYLYDPDKLYLCDRFFAVSGPVYDRVYGREGTPDFSEWHKYVRVVFMDPAVSELYQRYQHRGDDLFSAKLYDRVLTAYHEHVRRFVHTRVDGCTPPSEVLRCVISWWSAQASTERLSHDTRRKLAGPALSSTSSRT
jgi:thymidylate kinase